MSTQSVLQTVPQTIPQTIPQTVLQTVLQTVPQMTKHHNVDSTVFLFGLFLYVVNKNYKSACFTFLISSIVLPIFVLTNPIADQIMCVMTPILISDVCHKHGAYVYLLIVCICVYYYVFNTVYNAMW